MNPASKSLHARWPVTLLLGLVCSVTAQGHDFDDGYGYRHPRHHRHGHYGWQRPYYAPPPPTHYPGPPHPMQRPPHIDYGAPPVWREPPPPRHQGWR